jgi:mannose-6-phosphate isomerase-like protein (cupin superfamily)
LDPGRSTVLRKNGPNELSITTNPENFQDILIINGSSFKTKEITGHDLVVEPNNYYLIINKKKAAIEIQYSLDILKQDILYDPYKFENSEKINFTSEFFIEKFKIPKDYIDTLPKWYSFKFTYSEYNLIFVRPEFGLSIQTHEHRDEFWEIIEGMPIIINDNNVHYFVENNTKIQNQRNTYHSVINVNKEVDKFVIIKERWKGKFKESDIRRVFNPNRYH